MSRPMRKRVRETVRNILADQETGFNPRLQALLSEYGLDPSGLEIDFGPNSKSFMYSAIQPGTDEIDYASIFPAPIAMTVYTVGAVNNKTQNSPLWSGPIEVRIDVYLRYTNRQRPEIDTTEGNDTESIPDAIEEAIIAAVNDPQANWNTVSYNNDVRSEKVQLELLSDGWAQQFSILLICEVHV